MKDLRFKLFLSLLTAPFALSAQEVVLEKVEIKVRKEILTERDVRESFAKDPAEALTRIEGIWKLRKGGIANDIVLRAFQRENLNVLFDGARIYQACPNRMDPPAFHIDFSEVKEIEVVKGPFDVRNYGSLGGTVNIKTVEPKEGFHGRLNVAGGSFRYFNPSLNLSYGSGPFYGLVGHAYRYSKPYRTGEGKRFTEYPTGNNAYRSDVRDGTAFSINTSWVKAGFKPRKNTGVEISYTAQKMRDVLYPYLMMDSPEDNADRLNLTVELKNLKLTAYYAYVYHRMNNEKRVNPVFLETVGRSKTYGSKLEYSSGPFTAGLEAFVWNWKAETTMGTMLQNTIPDVDLANVGLFGEYRKALSDRLRLVVGVRLDSTKTEANRSLANTDLYYTYHNTRSTSKTDLYPSGNLQLFYAPDRSLELFAGIGYAVRVPSAQERYFALNRSGMQEAMMGDWVGNPNLKPSKNAEVDLGVSWKGSRANLSATVFYSFVGDFITVYNQGNVNNTGLGTKARSYANVDARFYGGEAKTTLALSETLFLDGGISYVRGKKTTDPSRNINDEDVAEIPPLRVRVALRYDTGAYFGEVEGIASATQNKVDEDLGESKTSGWGVLNVRAGGERGNLRITAGVENLLDKFYYEHLSYLRDPFSTGTRVPEPGRSFYLNVSYMF